MLFSSRIFARDGKASTSRPGKESAEKSANSTGIYKHESQ